MESPCPAAQVAQCSSVVWSGGCSCSSISQATTSSSRTPTVTKCWTAAAVSEPTPAPGSNRRTRLALQPVSIEAISRAAGEGVKNWPNAARREGSSELAASSRRYSAASVGLSWATTAISNKAGRRSGRLPSCHPGSRKQPLRLPALLDMAVVAQESPTEAAEYRRLDAASSLEPSRRAAFGQFFTPSPAARLIASMLTGCSASRVRLLDPGAGVGSLTAAAVQHFVTVGVRELEVVACEIDEQLHPPLQTTLEHCATWAAGHGLSMRWELRGGNYIETTAAAYAGELGTCLLYTSPS